MFRFIVVMFSMCCIFTAHAETLLPIAFIGQPLILLDAGRPDSCGIRIAGVQAPIGNSMPDAKLWVPDGSFMIQKTGIGLVKAIGYQTTIEDMGKNRIGEPQPINSFWFRAEGEKATVPINKVIAGDTAHSLIYATEANSVLNLIDAVISNKTIQFALKFESGRDIAFYGKASMSDDEIKQVISCIQELSSIMQNDLKTEPNK